MKKIAFIFSGRGSLLFYIQQKIETIPDAKISLVITNNPEANVELMRNGQDWDFYCIDHKLFNTREEHEEQLIQLIEKYSIDLIVLGGYRRIFTKQFVDKFCKKTINTHPSLLPSFIGDKAQLRAINSGVRITGATVHFIDHEVDNGPIIAQAPVEIKPSYSEQDLKEAIINVEKKILLQSIKLFIQGKLRINGKIVEIPASNESELFYRED